jgi:hypothetical protein
MKTTRIQIQCITIACLTAWIALPAVCGFPETPAAPTIRRPAKPPAKTPVLKAPEVVEVKTPTAVEVKTPPKAPDVVVPPKVPATVTAPKAPVVPKVVEIPKAPVVPKVVDSPKVPKVPVVKTAPATPAQPNVVVVPKLPSAAVADNQLGPGHKINNGKIGDVIKTPVSGVPTSGKPPSSGSTLPGGIATSLDPSARPDVSGFQKGLGTDLLGKDLSRGGLAGAQRTLEDPSVTASAESAGKNPGGSGYGNEESMVGAGAEKGTAGTSLAPVANDDEGVHGGLSAEKQKEYEGTVLGKVAGVFVTGGDNSTRGQALKQATDEIDGKSPSTSDSGTAGGSGSSGSSGSTDTGPKVVETHTSSDGVVSSTKFDDGTVVVVNTDNGTTTTQNPDGSTVTRDKDGNKTTTPAPSTSIPNPDNEGAGSLPPELQALHDQEMAQIRANAPKHVSGAGPENPSGGGDDTGYTPGNKTGATVDKKQQLLGGDEFESVTHVRPSGPVGSVPVTKAGGAGPENPSGGGDDTGGFVPGDNSSPAPKSPSSGH